MNRLVSDNLWKELGKLARGKRCSAAIAYVTSDKHLKFRRNDTLVTDASDKAIQCGETSARVLSAAHKRGAKLFSLQDLHAKILVCGRIAIVGSANLSASSAENLIEAAVIIDDAAIVAQATAFVDQLTGMASPIDDRFLKRILQIKVKRRGGGRRRRRTKVVEVRGGRAWLVGIREMAEGAHPEEADQAEVGTKKPDETYREITVRLWGKGVTLRREVLGSEPRREPFHVTPTPGCSR